MNKRQFLLLKLAEECTEVAQRASKQIQFGAYEVQDTTSHTSQYTNAERTKQELIDLMCVWKMLVQAGEIPEFTEWELDEAYDNKKIKLQKYLDYSFTLGTMPEIKL